MSMGPEIRLIAFDKAGARLGTVGDYQECRGAVRWNKGDTLEVTLAADHPRAAGLAAPGARLVAQHRVDPGSPWRHLTSGSLTRQARGSGRGRSTLTYSILPDFHRVFGGLLGWVNPVGGTTDGWVTGQGDEDAYWRMSGSVERVALSLVAANRHRMSVPVTVDVPATGRGGQVSVDVRMKTLQDALAAVLSRDVGFRVSPATSGPGLVVAGYVGRQIPQPLRESSGVVTDGTYSVTAPTATRVLVAGPGEGTARLFRLMVDEAREAEWGMSLEVFRDARDLKSDAAENEPPTQTDALAAAMDARAAETLAEGAAKASVVATLTDSEAFRFGVGYELGDVATVALDGAPAITERITEVEFSSKTGEGLTFTPHVGGYTDNPATAVLRVAAAALRGVRNLEAGR